MVSFTAFLVACSAVTSIAAFPYSAGDKSTSSSTTSPTPTPTRTCTALYGQCGGIGWTGPTCCVEGATCVRNNDYFYNCYIVTSSSSSTLPGTSSSSVPSTTSSTSSAPSPTRTCSPIYAQCGGGPWTGPTCCAVGSTCVYKNQYVSACDPVSSSSSSLPGTSSSSVPSTTFSTTTSSAPSPTQTCIAIYGQCGGHGYNGPTCCAAGSTCIVKNVYHSNCDPVVSSSSGASSTSSTASPSPSPTGPCSPRYGQCGGMGWEGPTCCVAETTCKLKDDYYSQCL